MARVLALESMVFAARTNLVRHSVTQTENAT